MKTATLRLDLVSAEKAIFTGDVESIDVTGEVGELGITPGHAALLTRLRPGFVSAVLPDKTESIFYISGGFLEVQPYQVTVLADTAERAEALDEAAAQKAKAQAEQALQDRKGKDDLDIARASLELAKAAAQIQAIAQLKKRAKVH